jgi:SecY interacting protein Syd
MKISNVSLAEVIWHFSQDYLQAYQQKFQHLPIIEQDKAWPSPCEQGVHQEGYSLWQPVKTDNELSFDNVESALEITLHTDIKNYFSSLFCDSLDASCDEGNLSLLFAWNNDDFARLQENIIGHILMKTKLKQRITVFFAVTDNEEHIISIDNESGEVWVEKVGCEPHKKLANSIAEFIAQLAPNLPPSEADASSMK